LLFLLHKADVGVFGSSRSRSRSHQRLWLCILIASMQKPMLQISIAEKPPSWRDVYVGLNVFTLNLVRTRSTGEQA